MLNKRLNYNVPQDLTPAIRMLAEMDGTTPAYWLRKALEKVVSERFSVQGATISAKPNQIKVLEAQTP
jgi:predicted DNA-binding protein